MRINNNGVKRDPMSSEPHLAAITAKVRTLNSLPYIRQSSLFLALYRLLLEDVSQSLARERYLLRLAGSLASSIGIHTLTQSQVPPSVDPCSFSTELLHFIGSSALWRTAYV